MAEDPSSTKPDLCSFDKADWVSATEAGEHIAQINHGAWMLAPGDIRDALLGGCSAVLELEQDGQKFYGVPPPGFWLPRNRLRWVNRLNPSMQREDYRDRPWPWVLRAYLEPWEFRHVEFRAQYSVIFPLAREQASTLPVFLRRAEAVQWGLSPALESPQAVTSEEPTSRAQPGEPTVSSAGGEAAPAPASVADASVTVANTEAPVAEPEVASSSPVDAIIAETAVANTEAPVMPRRPWRMRKHRSPMRRRPRRIRKHRSRMRRRPVANTEAPVAEPEVASPTTERPPPREQPGEPTVNSAGGAAQESILEQNAETASSASAASSPAAPQTKPESPAPKSTPTPTPTPPITANEWFWKARKAHPRQRNEKTGEYAKRLEELMPQSEAGVKKPWDIRTVIRQLQRLRKAEVEAAAQKGRRPTGDR